VSDSESEESDKPGCSDSKSQGNQIQLGNKMYSHSTDLEKVSVSHTEGSIELKPPLRSAHQQGNRGGHVPPEEAKPYNGGKFIETSNLTSQSPRRNTPPTLSCQRSWVIGRGRGWTRVEETKISTLFSNRRILLEISYIFNGIYLSFSLGLLHIFKLYCY